jgi:formiminotetrahydrofolate cyclodeaminase
MNNIWEWTLNRFVDRTASAEPTPGGGSVAAVCGCLGLSLVVMGLEITKRKSEQNQAVIDALEAAHPLHRKLKVHADEDIAVFEGYMKAFRLPKTTDDERACRKQAISTAALEATNVPLAAARDMLSSLEVGVRAAEIVKKEVLSDVQAGADILAGAVAATLLNVDANLSQLDLESSKRFAEVREDIRLRSDKLHRAICATVKERTLSST